MNYESKELSIYIHIPFCVQKCFYCDFLSGPASDEVKNRYVNALSKEIGMYQNIYQDYNIRSIFIGGGTPSVLTIKQMKVVLKAVKEIIKNGKNSEAAEVTIETNPGTLSLEKLKLYKEYGINRISIGLQSCDNMDLKLLGRIHTFEDFLESFQMAREEGFDNINVDLMSGLPGQTMERYKYSLKRVVSLNPEHLSIYSLIIEENTPFYTMYKEKQNLFPSEELDRNMYYKTKDILASYGYERYEISNYAKKGYESRHNISYWTGIPYLGFGLGASSLFDHKRYHNQTDLEKYISFYDGDDITIIEKDKFYMPGSQIEESLTKRDQMDEYVILGLRMMNGISDHVFKKKFGTAFVSEYPEQESFFINNNLLAREKDRYFLTEYGLDVSNQVFMAFLRKEK